MLLLAFTFLTLRFAVLTDTHVSTSESPAAKALQACIEDINALNGDSDPSNDISFVLHCGDETDFGTDEEEALVYNMLKGLSVPFYAVPGNHDATWSESGSNSFKRIHGSETFCFEAGGWRFVGCPCGPDVRMSPALISRESLVWLYSLPYSDRTIFINHYPATDEISNYKEYLNTARSIGTKLFIGGHHHINKVNDYDGTPGILCRSSLVCKADRGKESGTGPGYTIVTLSEGEDGGWDATACERHCPNGLFVTSDAWYSGHFCPSAKRIWSRIGDANIVAGFATDEAYAYFGTTAGDVKCICLKDGSRKWTRHLGGKIYSTPALDKEALIIGCADGGIYALNARNGKILWRYSCEKAVLASPAVRNGIAYIGASDGVFRALDIKTGALKWENRNICGHVITKALVDDSQVVFGSWGRTLYSLDPETGAIQWTWQHPHGSRMYSPAACRCVKSHGKIFVAIPDRKVWVFDAATGKVLGTVSGAREALGLSPDGSSVFSKSMHSELVCIDAASGLEKWRVSTPVGYDISPTELATYIGPDGSPIVLVPTDKGSIYAFSAIDGHLLWNYTFSVALVNPVSILPNGQILLSSMDGRLEKVAHKRAD